MIEYEKLMREDNIAKILHRSIILFRNVGNEQLADKWEKILKNYYLSAKRKKKFKIE